jgi:2',3'-cyclic-nucleotide 2'-phosphodiesterase (5'-nucleotidase family)
MICPCLAGDLVEGTGLSDAAPVHGQYIFPIAQQISYDGITIGNHDIGLPETVSLMRSTFIPALGELLPFIPIICPYQ